MSEVYKVGCFATCHICLKEKNTFEDLIYHLEDGKESLRICGACIIDAIKWIYNKKREEAIKRPWWKIFSKISGGV